MTRRLDETLEEAVDWKATPRPAPGRALALAFAVLLAGISVYLVYKLWVGEALTVNLGRLGIALAVIASIYVTARLPAWLGKLRR